MPSGINEEREGFIDENPELRPEKPDFTIIPSNARESDIQTGVKYYARIANIEPYGVFVSLANHDDWDSLQGLVGKEDLPPLTDPTDFVIDDEVTVSKVPNGGRDGKLRFKMIDVLNSVRDIDFGNIEISIPGEESTAQESHSGEIEAVADRFQCPECSFKADHPNVVRTHIVWANDDDHDTLNGFLDTDVVIQAIQDGDIVGTIQSPGEYPNPEWVDDYYNPNTDSKKNRIYREKLAHPSWPPERLAEAAGTSTAYPYSVLKDRFGSDDVESKKTEEEFVCLCGKSFTGQSQLAGHKTHCELWSLYRKAGKPDLEAETPDRIESELRDRLGNEDVAEEYRCICGKAFGSVQAVRGHKSSCELWHSYTKLGKPEEIDLEADPQIIESQLRATEAGESIPEERGPQRPLNTPDSNDGTHSTHRTGKNREVVLQIPVYLTTEQIRELLTYRSLSDQIGNAAIEALIDYER